jgi:hypothetical protein
MPTVARPAPAGPPIPPLIPLPDPPAEPKSPVERLVELDRLKAKNLISASEYETQKKRILGGM